MVSKKNKISSLIKWKIRVQQPFCIYSHKNLDYRERTIEHLIPVSRCIANPKLQNDSLNLWVADRSMNSFRSNHRFGGNMEEIREWKYKKLEGYYFREKEGSFVIQNRYFYPKEGHRLVAHLVWYLMDKYKLENERDIFQSSEIFSQWLKKPWTPIEKWMMRRF